MPLRSLAFLLYFLGSSAGSLIFPIAGVLCYLLLYHVYPQTTWWGKALAPFGIRYAYVCGLFLMIGTVLNINRLKFGRQMFHPIEWCAVAVFLTMFLSAMTGIMWNFRTDFVLDKMSKVLLFTFMMSHVIVTRKHMWYVVVLLAMMALYLGHEARNAPPSAFINNRLDGIGGPDFRESASLAIHLFALIPFVAIVFRHRSLVLKVLAFLAAGYAMNAILLCRARSAFLAAMITAVFAIWYAPRRHRRWVVGAVMLGAAGGLFLSDEWFWDRMITIFSSAEERDTSAAERLVIWRSAWDMFRDYPFGVGIGQFDTKIAAYLPEGSRLHPDAHNTYVLCATETGILGFAAYVLTLAASWWTLSKLDRQTRYRLTDQNMIRLFIFANRLSLLVYMISGLFVSRFYTEAFWVLIFMPACLHRVVENEARAEARQAAEIEAALPELARQGYLLPAT